MYLLKHMKFNFLFKKIANKKAKVSVKPFQRLAVSKGRAFGRTPQSAKPFRIQRPERGASSLTTDESDGGNPAREGFPHWECVPVSDSETVCALRQ